MWAKIRKRNPGYVTDVAGMLLIILFVAMLFVVSLDMLYIISAKREVDTIARNAILVLETEGNIDSTEISDKLNDLGFSNYTIIINENGGFKSYGEKVSINITVTTTPTELGLFKSNLLGQNNYIIKAKETSISKSRN